MLAVSVVRTFQQSDALTLTRSNRSAIPAAAKISPADRPASTGSRSRDKTQVRNVALCGAGALRKRMKNKDKVKAEAEKHPSSV
jgi:hypothetical protein